MAENRRKTYGGEASADGKPRMCRRCGCLHMERRYYGLGKDEIVCRNCHSIVALVPHEERTR